MCPVLGRGTATFDVVAAQSGGSAPPVATSVAPELPAMIVITKHFSKYTSRSQYAGQSGTQVRIKNYDAQFAPGMDGQWRRSYQATVTDDTTSGLSSSHTDYQWSHTNTVGTQHTVSDGVDYSTTPMDGTYNNDVLVKYVPDKSLDHEEWIAGYNAPIRYLVTHFWATGVKHRWDYSGGDFSEETLKARTDLKLFTGGKAKVARKSLIHISASAVEYRSPGRDALVSNARNKCGGDADSDVGVVVVRPAESGYERGFVPGVARQRGKKSEPAGQGRQALRCHGQRHTP
ncbi:MAG: hypothetical protein V9H26_05330 [Verrucomicrobiota bacterium]